MTDSPSNDASAVPRSSRALLIDRDFGPWFWGNMVSNSGSWLFNVTSAVVVFEITRSALMVGLISVAQYVPLILLGPWAGALSDRLDRRRLLLGGETVAALGAASIAVPAMVVGVDGLPGAWPVLVSATVIGVGKALANPARNALVPALVEDPDLDSAVSLTALTFSIGRALGPAGAGLLLVSLGAGVAFALNAASFLVIILALLVVRPRAAERGESRDSSVWAGLRHVRDDRTVRLLLAGVAAAGFATDPVMTLAPPLSAVLGGGEALVAMMVSGFGTAAIPAALVSGPLQRAMGSAAVARVGMWATAGSLVLVAGAPTSWVAVLGFSLAGAASVLAMTSLTTLLQRRVPELLRGRIMALWGIAFLGNRPVAAVIDGTAADLVGPRLAIGVAVIMALIGARLVNALGQPSETS